MTAVAITLDIGFDANRLNTATTSEIVERTGLAKRGIEPALQMPSRSGLLASTRGARGGYHLQRPRGQIKLSDILRAVQNDDGQEDGPTGALQEGVVGPLRQELDDTVRQQLAMTPEIAGGAGLAFA